MNFEAFNRATDILCDLNALSLDITDAAGQRADLRSAARLLDGVIDHLDALSISAQPPAAIAAGLEDACDDLFGVCGVLEHSGNPTLAARVQTFGLCLHGLQFH